MKLNWGTAIAVTYLIFACSMVLFAIKASRQNYDLVSDDYYDQAVNYQSRINAERNANYNENVKMTFSSVQNEIIITTDSISASVKGTLFFYKPDKASDDFNVPFVMDKNSRKIISANHIAHGYWNLSMNYKMDNKDYFYKKKIFIP